MKKKAIIILLSAAVLFAATLSACADSINHNQPSESQESEPTSSVSGSSPERLTISL